MLNGEWRIGDAARNSPFAIRHSPLRGDAFFIDRLYKTSTRGCAENFWAARYVILFRLRRTRTIASASAATAAKNTI